MRALIVEDEALLAWMIEEVLRERRMTAVDWASSEAQAVASANLNSPDVVVVDADVNSGRALAAVRMICADREIPTVIVTAGARDVERTVPGAVIIEKPFTEKALIDALERALSPRARGSSRGALCSL